MPGYSSPVDTNPYVPGTQLNPYDADPTLPGVQIAGTSINGIPHYSSGLDTNPYVSGTQIGGVCVDPGLGLGGGYGAGYTTTTTTYGNTFYWSNINNISSYLCIETNISLILWLFLPQSLIYNNTDYNDNDLF